jgi:autotransporter translocation and assembly factor TamB
MAERKVRSRLSRWLRRLFGSLALLLLLVLAFAAFLIGTAPGGRVALTLAEVFLPEDMELEVGEFSGRLFDRFELAGLDLRLPTMEFAADRVAIDWRATGVLRKQVHANFVAVDGLDVRLIERTADSTVIADESIPDSVPSSPVGDLPFDISFDSVVVADATFRMTDSVWVSGGRAVVRGTIDDYRLVFSGRAEMPDLPPADVRLSGTGSTTAVRLDSLDARALGGSLTVTGDLSWWPEVTWDAVFRVDTLRPAELLPDPDEWPGTVSLVGSSTGRMSETGGVELEAEVDTLYGEVRGERLGGRFEARLRGEDLELPAARIAWGPAWVRASGTAGETLNLEFEATAPDLGLLLPGSEGRVVARGSAAGPRETPRVRASFKAAGLALGTVSVESAVGDVDLDFGSRAQASFYARDLALGTVLVESAEGELDLDLGLSGPVGATVLVRDLSVAGRSIDSATAMLTGRRDAHRMEVRARGPGGKLELAANGGLDAANTWSGTVEAFQFTADTVGSWALANPAEISISADALRLGEACLESAPARVCAEGAMGGGLARVAATVDSFDVERLAPLMPEDLSAQAVVEADLAFEIEPGGELNGQVEVRTSEGTLLRAVRGETRKLFFEPIEITASSGPDGLRGGIELHVTDSTGVRVLDVGGRLESPVAIRSVEDLSAIRGRVVSAHLEVAAEDLRIITDDLFPRWDATGSFRAAADLEVDAEGGLIGSLVAATDSMVLQNTVRGQGWTLTMDPVRLVAQVGPDGLTGELDLVVGGTDQSELLAVSGQISLPRLTTLEVVPENQPVEGSLEVRVGDLGLVEAFLIEIADARGSFLLTTQVGGTLADLSVDGEADLSDGYALIPTFGLELTDIQFAASGRPEGIVEVNGQVRSGDGLLTLTGRSERYPSAAQPSVFQLRGERFLVLDFPEVNLLADPSLDLAFDGSTVRLTGNVVIPRGRLGFPDIPASAVTPSDDVRFVGDSLVVKEPPVPFGTDFTVTLGDDVFFNGFGFTSNLIGSVRVQQEPRGEPSGRGEVSFINGTFRSFGQELQVEPGRLLFTGPIDNPAVDARAFVRASDGTEAGFRIGGTVQDLDVSTYSVPPKPDSDVMAYILFGRPMNQTSSSEGSQASNSAAILGANMLGMTLAPSLGLDEARIDTGSSENKAQFVVGKYLSPRLFVGYGVGIYEPLSTLRIRYLLSARWSIEAITGDQQSTDLLWRIEGGGPSPEAEGEGNAAGDSEAVVE